MASRDKILFLVGEKKAEDLMIREFFSKFPDDQQNKIAKSILCTILEHAGTNWNPILDGYPFLKESSHRGAILPVTPTPQPPPAEDQSIRRPESEKAHTVTQRISKVTEKPVTPKLPSSTEEDDYLIPVETGITKAPNKTNTIKKL